MGGVMRLAKRPYWGLTALLLAGWFGSAIIKAQTTFGTIRGTVRDSHDAVIVGVAITVTNEGTAISRQTATDVLGSYEVNHLNPGLYTVTAEAAGFQKHLSQHINLETEQVLHLDIGMKVGEVSETISVTGEAPVIETETSTLSDLRTGRQIVELPNSGIVRGDANSGGIWYMMGLSPGNIRHEGTSQHTFNGTRGTQSNQIFDGTQLGDQRGGQISTAQPSFESIQEMKIVSVDNSAEYSGVATIVLTSKSGTNQLHGSGFQQYNSGSLNARNFFASKAPWRVFNDFGGRLGGPIVLPGYNGHNRTFFFFAYEGNRDHTQHVYNSSVPSLAIRAGDFSALTDQQGRPIIIKDPGSGQPFAGNVIPTSRISPVSLKVQNIFYPTPNFGPPNQLQQNLRAQLVDAPAWNHIDGRIDHHFNNKNSIFWRFTWRNIQEGTSDGEIPTAGYEYRTRTIHNMSLVDTHIFSSKIVNELRAGYAWHELPRWGSRKGLDVANELGLQGLTTTSNLYAAPEFFVTGFSTVTQIAYNTPAHMVYDFIDNVTVIAGRHSMKLGLNFRRNQDAANPTPNSVYGQYQFTGTYSGFSWSDFLLGIPQQTLRTTPRGRSYGRNRVYAAYVQDDFKILPNLTLNLGMRYEYESPFFEKYDQMYNFDQTTGALVVPSQQVLDHSVSPILPSNIKVVTAQQANFPLSALRTGDKNNFDPRVGFAWRPFGNARSVLRGGFGIFSNTLSAATFGPLVTGGPFISDETLVNRLVDGVPLFQFPRPFLAVGSAGTINVSGENTNLFNPYTMQWNVTIEQEFAATAFRASYIATKSVDLLYQRNINQPLPSVVPFDNSQRPFPQYGNIIIVSNGASSDYQSFQFQAERKFSKGVYYQVGWTLAKQLAAQKDAGELGPLIEDARNRNREWGDDDYFMRQRFVANFVWEMPFGPNRKWLSAWRGANLRGVMGQVIGGWNLTGISVLQTGQRFTPMFSGVDPSNTRTLGGRPDRIANGNLPTDQRSLSHWFDTSAFVVPPANAGRFGTAANGILEGPGTQVFSFGLFKNFYVKEKVRFELNINATNAFNHPNFTNPNANISSPTSVGKITSLQSMDVSGPRAVVIGTRIEF
jgi:hypothetical protein